MGRAGRAVSAAVTWRFFRMTASVSGFAGGDRPAIPVPAGQPAPSNRKATVPRTAGSSSTSRMWADDAARPGHAAWSWEKPRRLQAVRHHGQSIGVARDRAGKDAARSMGAPVRMVARAGLADGRTDDGAGSKFFSREASVAARSRCSASSQIARSRSAGRPCWTQRSQAHCAMSSWSGAGWVAAGLVQK